MNDQQELHPADERLLTASLEQAFGEPAESRTAPNMPRLAVAAMVLLGVAVTAAIWWQREPAPVTAQDPQPTRHSAEGYDEIQALPDDTQVLDVTLHVPDDASWLTRLRELRQLRIYAMHDVPGGGPASQNPIWQRPDEDALAPLAKLRKLESLSLPEEFALRAKHIQALQPLVHLHTLSLQGSRTLFDAELVRALGQLPNLKSLVLWEIPVSADALAAMRGLQLEELTLTTCPGLSAQSFEQLSKLASLQTLRLGDLGRGSYRAEARDYELLRALPKLHTLQLSSCRLSGEDVHALPRQLTRLTIRGSDLPADDYAELKNFAQLRHLALSVEAFDIPNLEDRPSTIDESNVVAQAIGTMRLQSFSFRGTVTDDLLTQLGSQFDLERLELLGEIPDLGALARSRALTHLVLDDRLETIDLDLDHLRPLRGCKPLRVLELCSRAHDLDAIQALVGERVHVRRGR